MAEEWDGLRSWQLASAGSCEVLYGRGSYATLASARSGHRGFRWFSVGLNCQACFGAIVS